MAAVRNRMKYNDWGLCQCECVYILAYGHRFVITVCGPSGDMSLSARDSQEERECAACQRRQPRWNLYKKP